MCFWYKQVSPLDMDESGNEFHNDQKMPDLEHETDVSDGGDVKIDRSQRTKLIHVCARN